MRTRALLIVLLLSVLLGISCWYQKNAPTNSNTLLNSLFATKVKYNGNVAIEKLAKHLTSDEKEQRVIADFLYNLEDVFHIDPHVLFQNADYLVVVVASVEKSQIKYMSFNFSNNEPRINMFDESDDLDTVYWNGRIAYRVSFYEGRTYYHSWYEGPSKYGKFSSGEGYGNNPDYWYKIIDLNKFDWYQDQQP